MIGQLFILSRISFHFITFLEKEENGVNEQNYADVSSGREVRGSVLAVLSWQQSSGD